MYKNLNVYVEGYHLESATILLDLTSFSHKIPNFISVDFSREFDEFNFAMKTDNRRSVWAVLGENEMYVPDSDELVCVDCTKLNVGSLVLVRPNISVPDRFAFVGTGEMFFLVGEAASKKEVWDKYEVLYPVWL